MTAPVVTPRTADEIAAQKKRNLWLALALVTFVILVGLISAIRIGTSDMSKSDGMYFSGSLEKESQPPAPELNPDE